MAAVGQLPEGTQHLLLLLDHQAKFRNLQTQTNIIDLHISLPSITSSGHLHDASSHLRLLGVHAVSQVLDVSLLLLGQLLSGTQLQLHLSQTLLQLLQTEETVGQTLARSFMLG